MICVHPTFIPPSKLFSLRQHSDGQEILSGEEWQTLAQVTTAAVQNNG